MVKDVDTRDKVGKTRIPLCSVLNLSAATLLVEEQILDSILYRGSVTYPYRLDIVKDTM